jgi:hypothetical protein
MAEGVERDSNILLVGQRIPANWSVWRREWNREPTFSSRTIVVDVPVGRMLVTGAGVDRHTFTASTPHRRLSRAFLESFDTVPRDA